MKYSFLILVAFFGLSSKSFADETIGCNLYQGSNVKHLTGKIVNAESLIEFKNDQISVTVSSFKMGKDNVLKLSLTDLSKDVTAQSDGINYSSVRLNSKTANQNVLVCAAIPSKSQN